jgi:uncharacterized protein
MRDEIATRSSWHRGISSQPPSDYRPEPQYRGRIAARDVMVSMRDGVRLCIDIYRPDTTDKLPALLAIAPYNKELLSPEYAAVVPPQPAWSALWGGAIEAGDTDFLIARGYTHIVGASRASVKPEDGGAPAWDYFHLIESTARARFATSCWTTKQ